MCNHVGSLFYITVRWIIETQWKWTQYDILIYEAVYMEKKWNQLVPEKAAGCEKKKNRAIRVMKDRRKLCFCGCHHNLNGKCKSRIVCSTTKKLHQVGKLNLGLLHSGPASFSLHSPSVPYLTGKKKQKTCGHTSGNESRCTSSGKTPLALRQLFQSRTHTHKHADILAWSVASHARKA